MLAKAALRAPLISDCNKLIMDDSETCTQRELNMNTGIWRNNVQHKYQ
jgi:hypothetical protein